MIQQSNLRKQKTNSNQTPTENIDIQHAPLRENGVLETVKGIFRLEENAKIYSGKAPEKRGNRGQIRRSNPPQVIVHCYLLISIFILYSY